MAGLMEARKQQPLAGIRVLELGNYIAAPTTGRLLADFGAEVIKVERPGSGDELRNWRLLAGSTSLLYRTINRNKKSITADLRTTEGQQLVRRLIPHCDILLENFRPGTLERWGLGPDQLDALQPRLVIVRISAFGQTGPRARQPGFAAVAEAMGGLRALVGEPDRPPSRTGVSIGDSIAGLYGAFGALMLLHRLRDVDTEQADRLTIADRTVDVALNEAVLSMMESLLPDFTAYGVNRTRTGGRVEGIAPSNAYECADANVVIAGNSDSIFVRFMHAIDRPDLASDPALATNAQRWERRDELDDAIGAWTATRTRAEVLARLESVDVPCGPVYTAADIVEDAQYRARGMIQYLPVEIGDGEVAEVAFPGIVPVIGGHSPKVRSLGPELGQHTGEVVADLLGRETGSNCSTDSCHGEVGSR